jgi:hypothetical protein
MNLPDRSRDSEKRTRPIDRRLRDQSWPDGGSTGTAVVDPHISEGNCQNGHRICNVNEKKELTCCRAREPHSPEYEAADRRERLKRMKTLSLSIDVTRAIIK